MIKIEGRYTFQLPIEEVYNALQNEALIRQAMPGQVTFHMETPTHYAATMVLDVPKFGGHYHGSLDITDTRAPDYYVLEARGEGLGRQVTAQGRVELTALGPAQTEVRYSGTTDALDGFNRLVQMAAPPLAARFANRGLEHLERALREWRDHPTPSDSP